MTGSFTVLASQLTPTLGLERCILALAREIDDLDIVCLAEDSEALERLSVNATSLGSPVRGIRRITTLRRAGRWLRSARGTVVVAGVWAAVPVLLVLRRSDDVRVVVWEHSLSPGNVRAKVSLRVLSWAARLLYRRAHAIVCVSAPLAERMVADLGGRDVRVIPNFVEVPSDGPAAPDRPRARREGIRLRLLTVGRLVPVKNTDLVLSAVGRLGSDVELVVAGDGPLRAALERRAVKLGIAGQVEFLGHVDDVRPLYEDCDAVVVSSRDETFGMAFFEAAACHRPVVSADFPVAREFVPRYVPGVVAAPTPDAFADAIRSVTSDPPPRAAYEVADELRRADFDPAAIRAMWRDVIEAVSG